jgi:hypothetical protein
MTDGTQADGNPVGACQSPQVSPLAASPRCGARIADVVHAPSHHAIARHVAGSAILSRAHRRSDAAVAARLPAVRDEAADG